MSLDHIDDAYPLSPVQQGMLFHILANPASDQYVTTVTISVRGELDVDRLRRAWHQTFSHHDVLRAAFLWDGLEEPLQVIQSEVDLTWDIRDWRSRNQATQDDAMAAIIANQRHISMDLTTAPLSRFVLLHTDEQRWTLVWTVHHLLADGWSTPIILTDVMRAYDQPLILTEQPSLSYASFVAWLAARDRQSAQEYWGNHLGQAEANQLLLQKPTQLTTQERDTTPVPEVGVSLSTIQTEQINNFCKTSHLTLATLVHGAWALLLQQFSNTDRVLFGSTSAGRSAPLPGIEQAVGMYLNTLPVCIELAGEQILRDWLANLQQTLQSNASHDALPLAEIQKIVPRDEGQTLFESIVVIEGHSADVRFCSTDQTVELADIAYTTHSNYPLALLAFPGSVLTLTLVYDATRFIQTDIERLAGSLKRVLLAMPELGHMPLASWRTIAADPRESLQVSIGEQPVEQEFSLIHTWFESVCDAQPDSPAVNCAGTSLTYRQLDEQANQLAHMITATCQPMPAIIGLLETRSTDQVVAMLGILKAGAAYLPIDPEYPAERIEAVLSGSGVNRVITRRAYRTLAESAGATALFTEDARSYTPARKNVRTEKPDQLAYVIYTSGSTGASKGVCISHAQLLYSTAARVAFYGGQKPRFLLLSSIAFDSSVVGLYWTLCTGGYLVLPEPGQEKDLAVLSTLIESHQISHTLSLPSLYRLLLQYGNLKALQHLKTVIVAGEACNPLLAEQHFEQLPATELFNEYGPTEACVWSSVHQVSQADRQVVPIGRPIGTSQILVLNHQLGPSPIGVEGEIFIGGPGVATGYLNDPTLTAERFINHPLGSDDYPTLYKTGDLGYWLENGQLVFTGRKDRQLKIRGFRVEPGEIEASIERLPEIAQALVLARPLPNPNKTSGDRLQLVAYYRAEPTESASDVSDLTALIAQHLRTKLPEYMCPSAFVALNKFAYLPNGKLDLAGLPEPTRQLSVSQPQPGSNAKISDPSQADSWQLAAILGQLLGTNDIGIDDNFFALGGDSITAIQFVSIAREAGINISVSSLTQCATLSELAQSQKTLEKARQAATRTGPTPLTAIQAWFFEQAHPVPSWWNQGGGFHLVAPADVAMLSAAVLETVSQHPELGESFHQSSTGQWTALIPPEPPPHNLVTTLTLKANPASLTQALITLGQEFSLQSGWMIRILILTDTQGRATDLYWLAHHLVIDFISADFLAREFESNYVKRMSRVPRPQVKPNPGTSLSLREWAIEMQQTAELYRAQPAPEQLSESTSSMPNYEAASEGECTTLHSQLEASDTARLSAINPVYSTRTQELVLIALSTAWQQLSGMNHNRFDIESHGRDVLSAKYDTSETVGWLTSFFPFQFSLSGDLDSQIKTNKDSLRQARDDERHSLIRRYLSQGDLPRKSPPHAKASKTHSAALLFNMIPGAVSAGQSEGAHFWQPAEFPETILRAPLNKRPHPIELNVITGKKGLEFVWRFSETQFEPAQIEQLDRNTKATLIEIIEHCEALTSTVYTPADFPDIQIDQDDLDNLLAGLD